MWEAKAVLQPWEKELPHLGLTVLRWTLICGVAAAPSFYFGLIVSSSRYGIAAMLIGVACYIAMYSYVVRLPFSRRLMFAKPWGVCIKVAFGIRIAATILLVGAYNDMLVGIASVSAIEKVLGNLELNKAAPTSVLATTILQGVLLNVELFLLAFLLAGVVKVIQAITNTK